MLKQWFTSLLLSLATMKHCCTLDTEGGTGIAAIRIVCEKQGFQAHPVNPDKYVFCMKFPTSQTWNYYVFDCPPKTQFNQESMVCTPCCANIVNPCDDLYQSKNRKKHHRVGYRDGSDTDLSEVVCP
ncbi:unnamed protein product [Orchesella dallaii]|uniref:Chitin-binding type-2 domain-containing protein n=1 Tax=Orchesella dallaii TaxID=48710 RepID=A0ABP1R4Y9_9HEXA